MSAFTGPLTITQIDIDWREWRIEQPLIYEVGALGSGRRIEVPAGFVTDGASIPRFMWALLPVWGDYSRPAVVHDWLGELLTRGTPHPEAPDQKTADRVFAEMMVVTRTAWLVRTMLYLAVRLADHFPALRGLGVHK